MQVPLAAGLMNFSKALRNIPSELESLMLGSSFLHSVTTEGEKEFFEVINSAKEYIKCIWVPYRTLSFKRPGRLYIFFNFGMGVFEEGR